jgi:hypothetical protein
MRKITPPQIMTASCWVRGSEMRGTFSASEMVANERSPSERFVSQSSYLETGETYTWLQRFGFPSRIDLKNPQQNSSHRPVHHRQRMGLFGCG